MSNACTYDSTVVALVIFFFRIFLKKHKLHHLIKRKFYILTTTIKNKIKINKKTQIHNVLQYKACGVQLWLLLILLNRDGQRWLGRVSEFLILFFVFLAFRFDLVLFYIV